MNNVDPNQVLSQMKMLANQAKGVQGVEAGFLPATAEFGNVFKKAIQQVNTYQMESNNLMERFELGDDSVGLAKVMLAMQKSTISFQALAQARNHFVRAYEDVMNMPI